ncbi:MAG: branched-chain amino acid transport system ATP-binding protein [Chloroflexota bacterium]|nr:branched-chain amino acid transport system ATP-binding protein [Chloroflexota bacterium]
MSLLSVEKVSLNFGGVLALDSVSFQLNRGEILGLIGPNGAGKTTMFNCISGVLTPTAGEITFEDQSLLGLKAHERAARGIARTFQNLQLWRTMTVLENCKTPMDALGNRGIVSDALRMPWATRAERAGDERARAVLHVLDLLHHRDELAGDLPVGIQRRVELARALCMRPKLLLLDEPASGLDAGETEHLADTLQVIRDRFKVSILLVDHDMSLVMRACHYIYVLDFGEVISTGRPEDVREDPIVISAYLGEGSGAADQAPAAGNGRKRTKSQGGTLESDTLPEREPLLVVSGLRAGYGGIEVIRDVSMTVGVGEVVACIGANGAGKTTTLRAISGVVRPSAGRVMLDNVDITKKTSESIVRLGMVHVPQGRGLFPKLTVDDTFALSAYSGKAGGGLDAVYEAFPALKDRGSQLVGTLSGGQQQMVAMARALLVKPKLLLIDEMSQGLAPAVVSQLFERLSIFKQQGIAVLLVEQFVDSALAISDRVYVFEQGHVAHEAVASVLRRDQALIASAYLGTAVDVTSTGGEEPRELEPGLMDELSVKLPAEIKRALQERALQEGKDTDTLAMELLGGKAKK